MNKELAYWISWAQIPKLQIKKKNGVIVKLFEEQKTLIDFFEAGEKAWLEKYELDGKYIGDVIKAKEEVPSNAFLAEDLIKQGYNIIPLTDPSYPKTLKKNLGRSAPPLLYTKGNIKVFEERSIAIVGSRKASKRSLEFTDNIAKLASKDYKVVVSGFAKGVDKQALDSAIKYKGQSIIVLPQGITTFTSGFRKYYRQISEGDVLVVSTFQPGAAWHVSLAMARNPIIYGLADEIYVAESAEKGGTWSGVLDGLKRGREIYVRLTEAGEKNANGILIKKGAVAVDFEGVIQEKADAKEVESVSDAGEEYLNRIEALLKEGEFTSKGILEKLDIDWNSRKMTSFLKDQESIETIKSKPLKFTLKEAGGRKQATLF